LKSGELTAGAAPAAGAPKHPAPALLVGYYGARNLGDEMMLFCLRRWLAGQNIEPTILCPFPEEVERSHGLPALENVPLLGQWAWRDVWLRGKAFRVVRALRRCEILIAGGGDFIRDDCGIRLFSYAVEKYVLATLLKKPVCLVNVGIGRPTTRLGRKVIGWLLRRCRKIIVRDRRSVEVCTELGAGAAAEYAPDIVLSLPALVGVPAPQTHPYLVVCLRANANVYRQYELTEARLLVLAEGLDELAEREGLQVVFLPYQSTTDEDDNWIHEQVAARMACRGRVTVRPWTRDLGEVSRCVSQARCVVAMRLHAAVLAAALQRPCVPMPYDHKVLEFAGQMGWPHAIMPETLDSPSALRAALDGALRAGAVAQTDRAAARWAELTLPDAPGRGTL
jgi:polysaccharide pyruvyl transferase CsaB